VLQLPAVQQILVREGAEPIGGTPAQLAQFTRAEFEKWRTVVRDSGASTD
jgi:tripartite-type tricarboxylate transporter receptor subunit TctC